MARTRRKRIAWSASDVKLLKSLAGRASAQAIARKLKRTAAAVRYKAFEKRISLAQKAAR